MSLSHPNDSLNPGTIVRGDQLAVPTASTVACIQSSFSVDQFKRISQESVRQCLSTIRTYLPTNIPPGSLASVHSFIADTEQGLAKLHRSLDEEEALKSKTILAAVAAAGGSANSGSAPTLSAFQKPSLRENKPLKARCECCKKNGTGVVMERNRGNEIAAAARGHANKMDTAANTVNSGSVQKLSATHKRNLRRKKTCERLLAQGLQPTERLLMACRQLENADRRNSGRPESESAANEGTNSNEMVVESTGGSVTFVPLVMLELEKDGTNCDEMVVESTSGSGNVMHELETEDEGENVSDSYSGTAVRSENGKENVATLDSWCDSETTVGHGHSVGNVTAAEAFRSENSEYPVVEHRDNRDISEGDPHQVDSHHGNTETSNRDHLTREQDHPREQNHPREQTHPRVQNQPIGLHQPSDYDHPNDRDHPDYIIIHCICWRT